MGTVRCFVDTISDIPMDNLGTRAATAVDGKIQDLRTLQEELATARSSLATLMTQRNENELLKQELDICEKEVADGKDLVIYKQVGPVILRHDLHEAKDTVKKRLEFISGEIKKIETRVSSKEENAQQLAKQIQTMQAAMQKAAVEAAKVAAAKG